MSPTDLQSHGQDMKSFGPFISRKQAQEQGLRYYFTGIPCKHGHIALRFTKRCQCCECNTEKVRQDWEQIKADPLRLAAARQFQRERAAAEDPEKKRERGLRYIRKKRRDPAFRAKEAEWSASPERRAYIREWNAEQMKDPGYRIARNLRNRLWYALEGRAASQQTLQLLGCSIADLKQHLQQQFSEGMSWENYGDWHVDHIRPCASFDLTDPAQQAICLHFSNLQPLWAFDNLSKGARE